MNQRRIQENKEITYFTDKYYEEMRKITPKFTTNDREHMLIIAAIDLVVREKMQSK